MKETSLIVPEEVVMNKIYLIRDQKVMLDSDLAELYGVTTGNLNKAVKRNIKRFPSDFMFQLNRQEHDNLKFHFGISSWGGSRKLPNAFTEQGVAMLSGILNSDRAIMVNIQIIRIFIKMREMLTTHKDLLMKMNEMEAKISNQDSSIKQIFAYLKQLIKEDLEPRRPVGFRQRRGD